MRKIDQVNHKIVTLRATVLSVGSAGCRTKEVTQHKRIPVSSNICKRKTFSVYSERAVF